MADPPKAKSFWRDLAIFRKAKNGGEAGVRTLGSSYPDQLLSRQLRSATPAPLLKNYQHVGFVLTRHGVVHARTKKSQKRKFPETSCANRRTVTKANKTKKQNIKSEFD